MAELECHICGHITDFRCHQCKEPVCEDCCVPFTLQNQIDYALCECCHDGNEARRSLRQWAEEDRQKAKDEKRKQLNKEARIRYWKPENVTKRIARHEARRKVEIELRQKQMEETMKIVSEMFGGMF